MCCVCMFCVCTCVCVCVCVCVCAHTYTHIHMHAHTHTHVHTHARAHTRICTHIHTHTHTHTHNGKYANSDVPLSFLFYYNHYRYLLTLSEFQLLVGKVEDNWKAAIKSGYSSLHIMDKFTLSVQIQRLVTPTKCLYSSTHFCLCRHSGFAVDTDISNVSLSANLPSLSFHFDEQKVCYL